MTFVELLKYSKNPSMIKVGNIYIHWSSKEKEWIIIKRIGNQHNKTLELFRSQDEQEVVNILFASQK